MKYTFETKEIKFVGTKDGSKGILTDSMDMLNFLIFADDWDLGIYQPIEAGITWLSTVCSDDVLSPTHQKFLKDWKKVGTIGMIGKYTRTATGKDYFPHSMASNVVRDSLKKIQAAFIISYLNKNGYTDEFKMYYLLDTSHLNLREKIRCYKKNLIEKNNETKKFNKKLGEFNIDKLKIYTYSDFQIMRARYTERAFDGILDKIDGAYHTAMRDNQKVYDMKTIKYAQNDKARKMADSNDLIELKEGFKMLEDEVANYEKLVAKTDPLSPDYPAMRKNLQSKKDQLKSCTLAISYKKGKVKLMTSEEITEQTRDFVNEKKNADSKALLNLITAVSKTNFGVKTELDDEGIKDAVTEYQEYITKQYEFLNTVLGGILS